MTWSDACALVDIPRPKEVEDKIKEGVVDFTDWVASDGIHDYARDVAFLLGDIPREYIDMVTPQDMLYMFTKEHLKLITDLIGVYPKSYEPTAPESIEFKGVTYQMPKSLRIDNTVVPMHDETAVTFTEASNVMKAIAKLQVQGIKHMNYFTAIYLRPEGEKYDEQKVVKRAKLFESLTMDVYWEVFFCIYNLSIRHMHDTLKSFTLPKTPRSLMSALRDGCMLYARRAWLRIFGKRKK